MAGPNDNHRFSVLIINPNTSTHMTNALKPILESLDYADIYFNYFTAPSMPSINSGEDSITSALHCRPFVEPLVPKYDAFLVACYSAHPLVGMLKEAITEKDSTIPEYRKKYVTGIFEASVLTSLSLVSSFHLMGDANLHKAQSRDTFGIMIVNSGGGGGSTARFAGVETTGLTASELHTAPAEEVSRRISDATERLIKSTSHPVSAICMGCAGMAGMEEAVRDGCIRAYGERQGRRVRIVDGVVAGAGMLVTACKAGF
ncbi:aspartate/glutamate racemase family protein [Aspergillus fumigatus Af293]|uniref:Hydantoin racemase (Dcg1), putative n=2 Tax=Aspergillus fumigatus TaxID=746128 RepID=Q4WSB2_ASPFU|nr:hydantoin racemase (Dcg1), putative [Aspergillus fumigatus Af293]EAL90670.1 hydantoin racemase (Dcg1), putative [Aspergillus fumigatus Af293]EDP56576.1 hydantoin racemase (Dcg1), putative [Aspergillus fumigatus A1163]